MAGSKKTVTIHRNAEDGRFVSGGYVKKHPSTTVTEHRPAPKPKK